MHHADTNGCESHNADTNRRAIQADTSDQPAVQAMFKTVAAEFPDEPVTTSHLM
jgi:hypothetical protein